MPILNLGDTDLYYESHGEGRPFLFNAATATWGELWKFYQVAEFSRDHQVIIFDQRGTGRSPSRSTDFSTARLAADAAALLGHLGARDSIVLGHSNGGRVAQALALDHSHLVGKLILASSGGTHRGARGIPLKLCMELVENGYERVQWEGGLNTGFTAAYRASRADHVERFMRARAKGQPSLEIFLRHVIGRQDFDSMGRLASLAVPTLVMVGGDEDHGAQGGMTHLAFAKQLAAEIPNAGFALLEDQGHYYYYSAPEEMSRVIRGFLAR